MNKKFSERNRTRCEAPNGFNHKLTDWSPSDWFIAVTGEVGEAANIIKKLNRDRDGIPGNMGNSAQLLRDLEDELADIYIYLDLFCQRMDINLKLAVDRKFAVTSFKIGYKEKDEE